MYGPQTKACIQCAQVITFSPGETSVSYTGCPMTAPDPRLLIGAENESQTVRALLEMRELLMHGEFKPGEHIREIPVAEKLGVSRTPARLVLERLAHEGLLEARA